MINRFWAIIAIFVVDAFTTERYFGWHLVPKSDAELIAVSIAMLIGALAFTVLEPGGDSK